MKWQLILIIIGVTMLFSSDANAVLGDWANTSCTHRRNMTISANADLQTDFTVRITDIDSSNTDIWTSGSGTAEPALLIYQNTTEVPFNFSDYQTTNTTIWFPLQSNHSNGFNDSLNYSLYYNCTTGIVHDQWNNTRTPNYPFFGFGGETLMYLTFDITHGTGENSTGNITVNDTGYWGINFSVHDRTALSASQCRFGTETTNKYGGSGTDNGCWNMITRADTNTTDYHKSLLSENDDNFAGFNNVNQSWSFWVKLGTHINTPRRLWTAVTDQVQGLISTSETYDHEFANAKSVTTSALTEETWHNVWVNVAGFSTQVWLDGVLKDTHSNVDPTTAITELAIGNDFALVNDENFNGTLDEFQILNQSYTPLFATSLPTVDLFRSEIFSLAPNITNTTINSPNGTYTSDTAVLNATITGELSLDTCWYNVTKDSAPGTCLGSSCFITVTCPDLGESFAVNIPDVGTFEDGAHTIFVYVNNSVGFVNTSSSTFTIDAGDGGNGGSPGGGGGGPSLFALGQSCVEDVDCASGICDPVSLQCTTTLCGNRQCDPSETAEMCPQDCTFAAQLSNLNFNQPIFPIIAFVLIGGGLFVARQRTKSKNNRRRTR